MNDNPRDLWRIFVGFLVVLKAPTNERKNVAVLLPGISGRLMKLSGWSCQLKGAAASSQHGSGVPVVGFTSSRKVLSRLGFLEALGIKK